MDKLYKILQNKLRSNEELPEDFTWENLGPSILNEVTEHVESSKPIKSNFFKYFGHGTIGLLALLSLSYFLFIRYPNVDLNSKELDEIEQSSIDQTQENINSRSENILDQKEKNIATVFTKSIIVESENSNQKQLSSNDNLRQSNAENNSLSEIDINNTYINSTTDDSTLVDRKNKVYTDNAIVSSENTLSNQKKPSKETSKKSYVNREISSNSKEEIIDIIRSNYGEGLSNINKGSSQEVQVLVVPKEEVTTIERKLPEQAIIAGLRSDDSTDNKLDRPNFVNGINQLPLPFNFNLETNYPRIPPRSIPSISEISTTRPLKQGKKWSFDIGVGTTYIVPNLSGDDFVTPARKIQEKGLFNIQGNFNVNYLLDERWEISLGISLANYSTKFEYYDSRDTMLTENILTKIEINSLTSGKTELYEDVNLNGLAWDQVIHHNNYKYLTIPVMITRRIPINTHINFGVGMGIHYSQLYGKTGKGISLSSNDYTTYSVTEFINKSFKSSSIGYSSRVDMNFSVNQRLLFGLELNANYSSIDMDRSSEITFRPLRIGAQIKFKYRL